MLKKCCSVMLACSAILLSGCAMFCQNEQQTVKAVYTSVPPKMNGVLDDPVWQKAPEYSLAFCKTAFKKARPEVAEFFKNGITDPGSFRLLWDNNYLYVGVNFKDLDVVAEGVEDQEPHDKFGDAAGIMLKPVDDTYFWHIYVSPRNGKKVSFYKARGLIGLPSTHPKVLPIKMHSSAHINGTVNSSFDKDTGWSAIMAIPIKDLNSKGVKLEPGARWKVLLYRINRSRYLPESETGLYPQTPSESRTQYEDFGDLELVK